MKSSNLLFGLLIVLMLVFSVGATITKTEADFKPASLNITYNAFMDFNFTVNSTVTTAINVTLWQTPVDNDTDWFRNFTMFCTNATSCGNTTALEQGFYNWYLEIDEGTGSNTTSSKRYFQVRALGDGENYTWDDASGSAVMWLDKNSGDLRTGGDVYVDDDLYVAGVSALGAVTATSIYNTGNLTVFGDFTLAGSTFTINGWNLTGNSTPAIDSTYYLGIPSLKWLFLFADNVNATSIEANDVSVSNELDAGGNITLSSVDYKNGALLFGDGDSGFRETADDVIRLFFEDVYSIRFDSAITQSGLGTSWRLAYADPTATSPNIMSDQSDSDTGIGAHAADNLSLIAGGTEIMRLSNIATASQVIVSPDAIQNNAASPSLAFGDGDTGWFESADDTLASAIIGTISFRIDATGAYMGTAVGKAMLDFTTATATVPSHTFYGDTDTGLGWAGADILSLIAGAKGLLRVDGNNNSVQINHTNWLQSYDDDTSDIVNMFKVDTDNNIQVGAPLLAGTLVLAEDWGRTTLINGPVSATTQGTVMEYVFGLDSNNMFGVYAEADGSGGIQQEQLKNYVLSNTTGENITMDFGDILDGGMFWAENFYGNYNWSISPNSTDYLGFGGDDLWVDMVNMNATTVEQITEHNASMKAYVDGTFIHNASSAELNYLNVSTNMTMQDSESCINFGPADWNLNLCVNSSRCLILGNSTEELRICPGQ